MQAITHLQRQFVLAYIDHPNYTGEQLAAAAGYTPGAATSAQLRISAHRNMHNEKVIAAINEETSKRLRSGGIIGVDGMIKLALNPNHKDHFRACAALADRTGFHALSEHKVVVDDKRPQTKQEMLVALKNVMAELGGTAGIEQLIGQGSTVVIDAEFTEVDDDEEIEKQMEDL